MMVVAGELLATMPPIQDPDYPTDHFTDWMAYHGLSRVDGNWLVDRRDPVRWSGPLGGIALKTTTGLGRPIGAILTGF